MATLKENTVYILLSIALIWNYRCMASNAESTNNKSFDCPDGATHLILCKLSQSIIDSCLSADEDTNTCNACGDKFFLKEHFNRCTICHKCSDCGTNKRLIDHCTDTSDTVCKSINTEPATTSQESTTELYTGSTAELCHVCAGSTTELYAGSTTAADKNPEPVQNCSSLDRLHVALIAVICVLSMILALAVCLLWKLNCFSWLRHLIQRNNGQQPNAGDGGAPPNNGQQQEQGVLLVPRNPDAGPVAID
ncbi:uncharacterized protein [Diadema antillarum]|uniref:uncharacterized protein isoform X2 n=1 Tax=Diadema antillarum TaxID=105358 RepID=UPI003A89F841